MGASVPRTLVWAAVTALFGLMTLGNVVSATGSGLACPDWPLCHGRIIPPLEPDILLEYGHRLMAIAASVLLVATITLAVRRAGAPPVRRMGLVLLALLGVQIVLGGATVLLQLPALVSTAHLLNALLILAGLLVLSSPAAARPWAASARLGRLARAGLAILLVQLVVGGYVRHAGAGLACPDFPLCSGDVLPGHWLGWVHWIHRWLGIVLPGLLLHVAAAARGTRLARLGALVGGLAVLQAGLGILTVVLGLHPAIRGVHAALGYLLWAVLVWLSVRAGCWADTLAARPTPRAREVAHVA
jgi:heme A synthase